MTSAPEPPPNPTRRKQIIDAAREIAATEGWPAVTVRAIGARIGCSAPAIYQYFSDKDEVLSALAEQAGAILGVRLDSAASATHGSAKRVRAAVHALWDFATENRELYAVIYGGDGLSPRGIGLVPGAMLRSVTKLSAKRGAESSAGDTADRLAASVHGFIGLALGGNFPGGQARARKLCDAMVDDLIRGLGRD